MKLLPVFFVLALRVFAQTFVYNQGYPKHCSNPDRKFPTEAVCTIPGLPPDPDVFNPPPKGGAYIDDVLGGLVRVVSDAGKVSSYSTPTALSATGKYLALEISGLSEIVRTVNGQSVRMANTSQSWGFWWSPADDNTYYRVDQQRQVIVRGNVTSGKEQVVLDPHPTAARIETGGTGDPSRDGWLPFWSSSDGKVCLAPLDGSGRLWCITNVPDVEVKDIDFILISRGVDVKTGKRYLVIENRGVVLSFDETTGLRYEYTGPEHPDAYRWKWSDGTPEGNGNGICEFSKREWCFGYYWDHADTVDINGEQYIFGTMEDEDLEGKGGSFVGVWRLSATPAELIKLWPQGGERRLLSLVRGTGFTGVGERHFGCATNVPVCLMSTNAYVRSKDDTTPWPPMQYAGEFMLFRFLPDGSYTIHRIAKHRSVQFKEHSADYYSMTRASISADGGFVAGTTDFGFYPPDNHPGQATDTRRMIVVRTGLAPDTPTLRLRPGDPIPRSPGPPERGR